MSLTGLKRIRISNNELLVQIIIRIILIEILYPYSMISDFSTFENDKQKYKYFSMLSVVGHM